MSDYLLGIMDTSQPQRILVLDPGEPPPKDKEVCAITLCEIDFEDEESLQACIATARAVRTLDVGRTPSHHVDNQTARAACEFGF